MKDISILVRSVERRIGEMAENVTAQETTGIKDAAVFSIALDESAEVSTVAHLAVVARYYDCTEREEL